MSSTPKHLVSRRTALAGFAITTAHGVALADQVSSDTQSVNAEGPIFSPSGPNAERYGAAEGFPIADHSLTHQLVSPIK
jgi:hypothetical protein